jgi:hypothetical protein
MKPKKQTKNSQKRQKHAFKKKPKKQQKRIKK